MSEREHTLEIHRLVARYGERTILSGVDLEVRPGEVHVILGGSGCGKTTLLKHAIGLLQPAEGTVLRAWPASSFRRIPCVAHRRNDSSSRRIGSEP